MRMKAGPRATIIAVMMMASLYGGNCTSTILLQNFSSSASTPAVEERGARPDPGGYSDAVGGNSPVPIAHQPKYRATGSAEARRRVHQFFLKEEQKLLSRDLFDSPPEPQESQDSEAFEGVIGGFEGSISAGGCTCPGSCRRFTENQGSFTDGSLPPCLRAGVPGYFGNKQSCWSVLYSSTMLLQNLR